MRGRIPKIPDFIAIQNRNAENQSDLSSELVLPAQSDSSSALQQVESEPLSIQGNRTSDRNRGSLSNYGFDNSFSDLAFAAPPKRPRPAGNLGNFQLHLHWFHRPYRILQSNSPRKPTFLRLSEKIRHLHRECNQFLTRTTRHWWGQWQFWKPKIKSCEKNYVYNQNCINCWTHNCNINLFFDMITSTYIVTIYLTGNNFWNSKFEYFVITPINMKKC